MSLFTPTQAERIEQFIRLAIVIEVVDSRGEIIWLSAEEILEKAADYNLNISLLKRVRSGEISHQEAIYRFMQDAVSGNAKQNCRKCGGVLIGLSSTDELICENCCTYFHWPLDDGQKSVLIEGRVGGIE